MTLCYDALAGMLVYGNVITLMIKSLIDKLFKIPQKNLSCEYECLIKPCLVYMYSCTLYRYTVVLRTVGWREGRPRCDFHTDNDVDATPIYMTRSEIPGGQSQIFGS